MSKEQTGRLKIVEFMKGNEMCNSFHGPQHRLKHTYICIDQTQVKGHNYDVLYLIQMFNYKLTYTAQFMKLMLSMALHTNLAYDLGLALIMHAGREQGNKNQAIVEFGCLFRRQILSDPNSSPIQTDGQAIRLTEFAKRSPLALSQSS